MAKSPTVWVVWRKWADGSITGVPARSFSQLKKILKEETKAVSQWKQEIVFDLDNCEAAI